jgi:hypothetical protein
VWRRIAAKHRATGTSSPQENLSDTLDTHRERVDNLRGGLACPEGAAGIAVAMNGRAVCFDIFDKATTLAKLWDRLVQGLALDALEYGDTGSPTSGTDSSVALYKNMVWRRVESVGIGEAYRATGSDGTLASALVVNGTPIHVSMSMPTGG